MVYIRSKRVKGIEYAYLVKSEWNANGKTSRQQTIKYLGRSSDVELEDIPTQYRQDPKILSFLSEHSPRDLNKKKMLIKEFSKKLYLSLASGDVDSATRIDDATKHVCTNTAYSLVAAINERISKSDNREKILLCCPEGELHGLSASVIESVLESRGYRVFNATPSIPADSIIAFIRNTEPDLIMISITLSDNIKAGERLVKRIRSEFSIPILVGGLAISFRKGSFHGIVTSNPQENSIEDVLRLVRSSLRKERTIASLS